MKKVAYISDNIYIDNNKECLKEIDTAIKPLEDNLLLLSPLSVPSTVIGLVHSKFHIVDHIYNSLSMNIDIGGCSKNDYDVALEGIGAGIRAVDGISRGEFDRAFCAVRPAGHHINMNKAMMEEFCQFNNCAITAKYAQFNGYERVMIIDFDVHHGDGTQDTFYNDNSVFYFSSHQLLSCQNSGLEDEIGEEDGEGYTANHILMPNSGDKELLDIYQNKLPKFFKFFNPDIILVSAGYDLHKSNPLAMLNITSDGISKMVRVILDLSNLPVIFILEGGYEPKSLAKNIKITLEEMMK